MMIIRVTDVQSDYLVIIGLARGWIGGGAS